MILDSYVNRVINYSFMAIPLSEEDKLYTIRGYNDITKTELISVASKKKILPVVGKFLVSCGIDVKFWLGYYNHFKDRNTKIILLLNDIFIRFHDENILQIFAYENFGAMLSADADIALYSSGDVDLYANIKDKKRIEKVLADFGYRPTQDVFNSRKIMTEYLVDGGIIRINIDWIVLRRLSLPISINVDRVIDWRNLNYYKGTSITLPSKEALLYLCFLRVAVHGFSRSPDVRLYIDTINVTIGNPNWTVVLDWAKKDNTLTKFIAVAGIAAQLNGIKIPNVIYKLISEDKYAQYIINQCFDFKTKSLIYEPSGIKLLKIEAAADNVTVFGEVMRMLFPSHKWLTMFYKAENELDIKKYFNYYKRLLKL